MTRRGLARAVKRAVCVSLLLGLGAPLAAEPPAAWATLERICRDAPYEHPMDAVTVAHIAGWQELGLRHLLQAAQLYGSLWTLQYPLLDIRTASTEEIRATYRQMRTQFLVSWLRPGSDGFSGVLWLEAPDFTAFVQYQQSEADPHVNAFPCQIHVLGRAAFLDSRFDNADWEVGSMGAGATAVQMTEAYLVGVRRDASYGDAVTEAELTLPDYSVLIQRF